MIYVDTSVIVAMLTVEPMTEAVKQWYARLHAVPVSSDWCATEFASAIAIKVRTGGLSARHAKAVARAFDTLTAGGLRLLPVSRDAFHMAARLARQHKHGLRAGDALHLAVAKEARATGIGSLDSALSANARRLGLRPVQLDG